MALIQFGGALLNQAGKIILAQVLEIRA